MSAGCTANMRQRTYVEVSPNVRAGHGCGEYTQTGWETVWVVKRGNREEKTHPLVAWVLARLGDHSRGKNASRPRIRSRENTCTILPSICDPVSPKRCSGIRILANMADDYDKLTPEEREAKDKAGREREEQEQAGGCIVATRDRQDLTWILEKHYHTHGSRNSENSTSWSPCPRGQEGRTSVSSFRRRN